MRGKTGFATRLKRRQIAISTLVASVALVFLLLCLIVPVPVQAQYSAQALPPGQAASQGQYGVYGQTYSQTSSQMPSQISPQVPSLAPAEFMALADTQNLQAYTIRYKDDFNGTPGAIFLTVHGDGNVELSTYSTPYHPLQGYTGFYTWQIGQDLLADLIRLLNSKEFVEEPSQETIKPDQAYQRLALFKDHQEVFNRFYTSETLPPPLTAEIMRRLHDVVRQAMTGRPVRGLSVEMNNLSDIRAGEPIVINYIIRNIGTEPVSIDNFNAPALITLFISGEGDKDSIYVELDQSKFTASRKADASGSLLIPGGDSVALGYKITANNLQKGAYYVAAGSQLNLSYTGNIRISSQILIYARPQTFHILD